MNNLGPSTQRIFERRCSVCRKLSTDFSPTATECRGCRRVKGKARYHGQKAEMERLRAEITERALHDVALGFIQPDEVESLRAELTERALHDVALGFIQPDEVESHLLLAVAAYLGVHGFGQLHLTLARLENGLARARRAELAREGWIA